MLKGHNSKASAGYGRITLAIVALVAFGIGFMLFPYMSPQQTQGISGTTIVCVCVQWRFACSFCCVCVRVLHVYAAQACILLWQHV
jgi:hypothetical protein